MWSWLRLRKRAALARKTFPRFVPVLERLEPRLALAGNVAAIVSAGNLIVTGDNLGADITISQPAAGQITISSNDTTVNGSTGPVAFSGVTRNLSINFGKGDDSLTFDETNPITLSGNLSINGGQGSNTASTLPGSPGSLNVGGNLSILNLPGPTETTDLLNLNVKGNVQIQNGPGSYDETDLSANVNGNVQIVNLGTAAFTSIYSSAGQNTIGGSLQIINGPGQAGQTATYTTQIDSTEIGHNLKVASFGSGNNYIGLTASEVGGSTTLNSGNGNNTVLLDNAIFGGDFQLQAGNGAETTALVDSAIFSGGFLLQTGNGADTVSLGATETAQIARVVPETREGIKTVYDPVTRRTIEVPYTYIVFKPVYETITAVGGPVTFNGPVTVNLGGGDDTLNLAIDAEVTFQKAATLDGQGGQNTAYADTANVSGLPKLKDFQVIDV